MYTMKDKGVKEKLVFSFSPQMPPVSLTPEY